MKRTNFAGGLILSGIILLSLASCSSDTGSERDKRPNIVLIVSDDHGMMDAGCYGNSAIHTPNIDRLAANGIRLTRAHCTSASCSASRSVILTGLYNHANGQYGHHHGVHHFRTFDDVRSLPVMLSDAGYETVRIGKFHVGPEKVFRFRHTLEASLRNPVAMADSCLPFLKNTQAPFFLYYATGDPHRGGGKAEDLPWKPDRFGNRDDGYDGVEANPFQPDQVSVPPYLPDTPASRAELAQYYQSVARLDQGIGRLITHLKATGNYHNSVIIYISDNGIAFPGAKTNLYDPAMRLPCIIRTPGNQNRGGTCDAMVTWADLTPTILDFAGAMTSDQGIPGKAIAAEDNPDFIQPEFSKFHGRSFREALKDPHPAGFDEIFASHTFHEITMYYPMRVVQNRRYKLIWNVANGLSYPHASDLWSSATWQYALEKGEGKYGPRTISEYRNRPPFELYDMKNDSLERTNLAGIPDYSHILAEMKDKLKSFQQRTWDPWRVKWEHE